LIDKESIVHIAYMNVKLKDLYENNKALLSLYKNIHEYIYNKDGSVKNSIRGN
jgi:hypothetical protein